MATAGELKGKEISISFNVITQNLSKGHSSTSGVQCHSTQAWSLTQEEQGTSWDILDLMLVSDTAYAQTLNKFL